MFSLNRRDCVAPICRTNAPDVIFFDMTFFKFLLSRRNILPEKRQIAAMSYLAAIFKSHKIQTRFFK